MRARSSARQRACIPAAGTVPVGLGVDVCPAPCPASQIIMPSGVFGQSSLILYLEPARATFVERINQLDFKVSRTFKVARLRADVGAGHDHPVVTDRW